MDPVFVGVAGVFFLLAAVFALRTWLFLQRAVTTEGTVVALEPSSGSKGGTVYRAVVEYRSPAGMHRIKDPGTSSHPGVEVGELVPVKYDPKKPDKGRQGSPFKLWGLPGFMVLMGVLFLVGSSRVGG